MLRKTFAIIDTLIFLWLAIKGLMYIGYAEAAMGIIAGCFMVCTAIFWQKMEKDRLIGGIEHIMGFFVKK